LKDITLRAIETLKEVDVVAAEDTRHTLKLLNHLEIKKPLVSYYKQNERAKTAVLIEKILGGENVALVSDAGTPGISDPGGEIIRSAITNNIKIIPIPGACALINALVASGLCTKEFSFIGFLPQNKKEKKEKLEKYKALKQTLIFYEAPHKLVNTLEVMRDVLGDREAVLAKEITKIHEEFIRGKISAILAGCEEPKGEYVVMVEGSLKDETDIQKELMKSLTLEKHMDIYLNQGMDKKEAIKQIAKDRGVQKNEIYQYFLR